MTQVTIEVTAEDIAQGEAFDCGNCPIARAAKRALKKICVVNLSTAYWSTGSAPLTKKARAFVKNFDSGRPVQPFTFTLDVPS